MKRLPNIGFQSDSFCSRLKPGVDDLLSFESGAGSLLRGNAPAPVSTKNFGELGLTLSGGITIAK